MLIVTQLVKTFSVMYRTRSFVTVFIRARPYPEPHESSLILSPCLFKIHFNFILPYSYLCIITANIFRYGEHLTKHNESNVTLWCTCLCDSRFVSAVNVNEHQDLCSKPNSKERIWKKYEYI